MRRLPDSLPLPLKTSSTSTCGCGDAVEIKSVVAVEPAEREALLLLLFATSPGARLFEVRVVLLLPETPEMLLLGLSNLSKGWSMPPSSSESVRVFACTLILCRSLEPYSGDDAMFDDARLLVATEVSGDLGGGVGIPSRATGKGHA